MGKERVGGGGRFDSGGGYNILIGMKTLVFVVFVIEGR